MIPQITAAKENAMIAVINHPPITANTPEIL